MANLIMSARRAGVSGFQAVDNIFAAASTATSVVNKGVLYADLWMDKQLKIAEADVQISSKEITTIAKHKAARRMAEHTVELHDMEKSDPEFHAAYIEALNSLNEPTVVQVAIAAE